MTGKSVLNWYDGNAVDMEDRMVKRRITLTGQQLADLESQQAVLKTQLQRSNNRVAELETGLDEIKKLASRKKSTKVHPELCGSIVSLVDIIINPPVKKRVTEHTHPGAP